MAEAYSFSKHLRAIVGPELRAKGFKLKGVKFSRSLGDYLETVDFQRSRWNINGLPFEFYVNIGIKADSWGDFGRLKRPTQLPLPEHYRPFFEKGARELNEEQKQELMDSFSPSQRTEIYEWVGSKMWRYQSEPELIAQFSLAVDFFVHHLDEIFNEMRRPNRPAYRMDETVEKAYLAYRAPN